MMETLTLANVAAYSAQVFCVVALASVMAWVLRVDAASVRYAYWRATMALCLLLPLVQGRQMPAAADAAAIPRVETEIGIAAAEAAVVSGSFDWTSMILPLLAAGAAARLLWIALSLIRLGRLRRAGNRAPESELHTELQGIIGTLCEIRYVPRLRQPVTFGFWRPVILLPASLADRNLDIQRAVLSHELFHVKRRDWAWLLVEELVCALLWFHPAVWWIVSRVHLAREVVVDELAVLATGRRRTYVEALMTFADETSLTPVAAFGGRRQLFNRIVLLSKEAVMSSHRLVFTCGVMAAALAAGSWQAVGAFPLTAVPQAQVIRQNTPGPLEQRANPVTPENPVPRRVNHETPMYPYEAQAAGATGTVTLMITLDELGRVAEARRIRLSLSSTNPQVRLTLSGSSRADEQRFLVNRSPQQSDAVRAIAEAFTDAAVRAVQQWRYDPPAAGPISFPVAVNFSAEAEHATTAHGMAARSAGANPAWAEGALRIGDNIKPPKKLRDVRPVYPAAAQAANLSGVVIVEIRVGTEGLVEDARVLRSIPALDQAALDAVMQWRFMPTLMNGVPVPVIMTVTVNFVLQSDTMQQVSSGPTVVKVVQGTPQGRRAPTLIKHVSPSYTSEAMRAGIQGIVEVEATIGTEGKVVDARVTRSLPMLDESALTTVRQWEFTRPAEPVTVTIELAFSLKR